MIRYISTSTNKVNIIRLSRIYLIKQNLISALNLSDMPEIWYTIDMIYNCGYI